LETVPYIDYRHSGITPWHSYIHGASIRPGGILCVQSISEQWSESRPHVFQVLVLVVARSLGLVVSGELMDAEAGVDQGLAEHVAVEKFPQRQKELQIISLQVLKRAALQPCTKIRWINNEKMIGVQTTLMQN
jgi:hypothetical protein